MSDHLRRKVAEFHERFGVERLHSLYRHEQMATAALRAQLLVEEGREVREADVTHRQAPTRDTIQHVAKELADVLYVSAGTAHILATPLRDPSYLHIPIADLRRYTLISPFFAEGILQGHIGRAVESLTELARMMHRYMTRDDYKTLIADEIGDVGADLQDVVNAVSAMAACYRIPLLSVFNAVHVSNMSKMDPKTGQILRSPAGKILKGPNYREPDLEGVPFPGYPVAA